jgi:HAD superfamily hydrolase (TIGR01549 family)
MMPFSAIIFDMDGTLVDTLRFTESAYAYAMSAFGVQDMPSMEFRSLYEKNVKTIEYLKHFSIDSSHLEDFRRMRDLAYVQMLREKVEYIDAIHQRLGLLDFITVVVCADDEGYKRKPDPFTLLQASHLLGIDPQSILYIGDQLTDIQAAKMAKMQSCLLTGITLTEEDIKPNFIVRSLHEMQNVFLPSVK